MFVAWLLNVPASCTVHLWAETEVAVKVCISRSHSVLTPGQPVLDLYLTESQCTDTRPTSPRFVSHGVTEY